MGPIHLLFFQIFLQETNVHRYLKVIILSILKYMQVKDFLDNVGRKWAFLYVSTILWKKLLKCDSKRQSRKQIMVSSILPKKRSILSIFYREDTKGQLISKEYFEVFIWTKKTNKNISLFQIIKIMAHYHAKGQ